jgi:hypothetical protein
MTISLPNFLLSEGSLHMIASPLGRTRQARTRSFFNASLRRAFFRSASSSAVGPVFEAPMVTLSHHHTVVLIVEISIHNFCCLSSVQHRDHVSVEGNSVGVQWGLARQVPVFLAAKLSTMNCAHPPAAPGLVVIFS